MNDEKKTKAQLIEELKALRESSRSRQGSNPSAADPVLPPGSELYYDSVQAGIILQAADGSILYANKMAADIFAMPPETIAGKDSIDPVWNMVDEDGKPVPGKDHPSMITLRTGKPFHNTIRGLFADDPSKTKWIQINTEPIFEEGKKKPARVMITFVDITRQKRLEVQAREDERLLDLMAQNYPNSYISIIEKDLSVGYTAGQEFAKLGLDPADFIGLTLEEVFGEQAGEVKKQYLKTFAGEEREFQLFINGQHQFYRTVPLVNESGDIERIMAVVENITEKVKAEEAINRNQENLSALMENQDGAIWSVDKNFRLIVGNSAFDDIIRQWRKKTFQPGEQVLTSDFSDDILEFWKSMYKRAMTGERFSIELPSSLPGGNLVFEYHFNPIVDESGVSTGVTVFGRDITDKKESVRQKQILIDKYEEAQSIAHVGNWERNLTEGKSNWSKEIYRILGLDPDEDPPHHEDFVNRIHPDDRPEVESALSDSLKTGLYQVEYRIKRFDNNEERVINSRGKIEMDREGRPVKLFGTAIDVTDLRQTEQALKKNEIQFRNLVTNLPGMTYRCRNERDWPFLFVSEGVKDLTGYSPGDLLPDGFIKYRSIIHPDDRQMVWDTIQEGVRNRSTFELEYRILTRTGSEKWVWERGKAISDESDEKAMLEGLIWDITDRKKAEDALAESRKKYQLIVDNQNDLVVQITPDLRIMYASPSYCRTFGRNETELIGKKFTPKIHKDDLEKVKASLACLSEPPHKTQHDERSLTADGWGYFTWSARAILDENGQISSIISVGRDITDKMETRLKLESSEEKYRLYFEHSPVGYQSLDKNGTFLDVNPTWLNILGYERDEVIGKFFGDFLHPEEKDLFCDNFKANIKQKGIARGVISRLRHKKGHYLSAEYTIRLGRDKDGNFLRTHCVFQDITERLEAEESLKRSELKLRSYIENSPYGIFQCDGEGRYVDVNAAACKITGYAFRDLLKLSIPDLVPDENKDDAWENFEQLLAEGCASTEIPFQRESGERIVCSVDSVRIGDGSYLEFVQDITEKKRSEENALRTAREWQATFDSSEDIIWILDSEQKILRSNRKAKAYFGKEPEELVGMHCWDIVHDTFSPVENCPIIKASHSLVRETMDMQNKDKWLRITVDPILDGNGKFNGGVHVISDITARKKAEQELLQAKLNLEEAQAVSHTGSWEYDIETATPSWSKEALRIFGLDLNQEAPTWIEQKKLLVQEDWEILDKAIDECIESGTPYSQEFRHFRPDGEMRWAHSLGRAVKDAKGNITKLMGTVQDIHSRKMAELERNRERESAARYLDLAKVMFVQLNADGTVGMVNPKACEVLGYREEEILGRNWVKHFIPQGLRNDFREVFDKIMSGEIESVDTYENQVLRKDGEERIISWHKTQIHDDDGRITGLLGSGEDVTEERKSQQKLSESLAESERLAFENEEFFKSAQQVLTLGSFEKTARGLFDACRRLTGAVSGYVALLSEDGKENNLLFLEDGGLPCSVDTELPMPIRGLRERCYLEGRAAWDNDFMKSEWIEFMPEGHVVLKNVLFAPLNIACRTVGIIGLANKPGDFDEHDARIAETLGDMAAIALNVSKTRKSLQDSEKWNRDMINASPDALFVLDDSRNITEANNTALSYYGYSRPAFLSMSFDDLTAPENTSGNPAPYESLSQNRSRFEAVHQRKDGSKLEVEIHTRELESSTGENLLLASVRDIAYRREAETERLKLQEQLNQAQKMESIGRLAGGVAHDFNNLLTAIQGFSELLQGSLSEGDPMKKDVEEIQKAAESAASLTSQLLTFSRKQIASPKILDLNNKISGSEKMLRRIIGEDVNFIFTPGNNVGNVFIDQGQVDQILINLMVNARDALSEGGRISIETGKVAKKKIQCHTCGESIPGEFVVLSVTDNGTGMDAETLQNIFEPFYTTKDTGKGTGLGLSTIHGIIHQNEGHISIVSAPGKGSTFNIYLPAKQGEAENITESEKTSQSECDETILLVEDKEIVRKLVLRILKNQGYKVIEAANGGEAFLKFEGKSEMIDLLLTDVIMPEMSGKELYERLVKIKPGLKALFMSGYTEDTIADHGILEDNINFIQKPFRPQELAAKLREVISKT